MNTDRSLLLGPTGFSTIKTFGDFGVVSGGENWARMASATRRWAITLEGDKESAILSFPDDALVLAGDLR